MPGSGYSSSVVDIVGVLQVLKGSHSSFRTNIQNLSEGFCPSSLPVKEFRVGGFCCKRLKRIKTKLELGGLSIRDSLLTHITPEMCSVDHTCTYM